jgi:hypothetical protein
MEAEAGKLGKKFVEERVEVLTDQFPILSPYQGFPCYGEAWLRGTIGGGRGR